MRRPVKDFVAFAFASVLCGYAAWSGQQYVAIASLIAVLCVLYKKTLSRTAEIGLGLLGRTTRAKYGDFEMQVDRMVLSSLVTSTSIPDWAKEFLSEMGARHLGLLLTLSKTERLRISPAVIRSLRELRDLGLVEHDQDTIGESEYAWLSGAGRDLVAVLSSSSVLERSATEVAVKSSHPSTDAMSRPTQSDKS
jgi:hypothetical protein